MQCDECNERPATLQLSHEVNGQKVVLHVCEVCAKRINDEFDQQQEENFTFHDLLTGLFQMTQSKNMDLTNTYYNQLKEELRCDHCQLTFREFQHIGKFGCAHCYDTFSSKLDSIFRRAQSGNTNHYGKTPYSQTLTQSISNQIEQLKTEMKQLIEIEAFEKAAVIRDKIKALEAESED